MSEKLTTLSQLRAVSQKSKDRAAQVADAAAAALDEMDGVKADKTEFVSFSMATKLDVFYAANKLTEDEYNELTALLAEKTEKKEQV